MIKLPRALRAALAVALLLSVSATFAQSKIDDILSKGEIVAGIALSGPPIGSYDAQNRPIGYDVDVATKIADALGVDLKIVEVTGANRIPMLQSGKVDIVVANMTATLERAKAVDFTIPYLRTGIKLLVKSGSDIQSIEDFNGRKVAVGRGTTGEALVKELAPNAELTYVDAFTNAVLLLQQGRVDATIEDGTLVDFVAGQNDGLTALPKLYTSDPIGIGVPKGEPDLLRWLDMFVSQFISSGDQAKLYEKWWGVPPTSQLNYLW